MSETEIMDTGQQLENKLMHNHTKLIHILSIAFEIKNKKIEGFHCWPEPIFLLSTRLSITEYLWKYTFYTHNSASPTNAIPTHSKS